MKIIRWRNDFNISAAIFKVVDVGYTRWPAPGSRNEPVRISSITYGVVPEGFEEETAARPLEPGVEYCVEVYAGLIEPVVECFIY